MKEENGTRNVVTMGLVSLFTDISSEMVFGLLPLFLTGQLGASRAVLGLVEGVAEMLGYTVRMPSGAISDRVQKRKPFVILGYSVSAAAKPLFALAGGWADVFAVRSADRVGKGIRTAPRDALISESVPEVKAGRAFGIHRSLDQAGAIIGPLVAFALFPFVGFSGVFYVSLIPGAIAVIILIFFVKEKLVPTGIKRSIAGNVRNVLAERRFVVLLAIMGVFSIGAFNFAFILVRASDLGVADSIVILVYAVINGAHTLIGYPAGMLSDRIGRENVLMMSYGVFLASTVMMLMSTSSVHAYMLAAVYGAYIGIAETVQRAVVPKYIASEFRGTAYGLYNMVIGFSFLAANLVFGFLLDSIGISAAATYSIITSAVAIAAMGGFQALSRPRKA
ncbi:MAG TPA: MFS transporter [Nitrososphaera sp.]|nr:MFS transporter [Nitrososphaera sp.]